VRVKRVIGVAQTGVAMLGATVIVALALASEAAGSHNTTTLVSQGQAACAPGCGNGGFDVFFTGASASGSRVFFHTQEALVGEDDDTTHQDVYERSGGSTTWISADGDADADAIFGGASADGSRVFFTTNEPLEAGDEDLAIDVYERSGGTTTGISTDGDEEVDASFAGASADGTRVFFETEEAITGAGDGDTATDVYERSGGTTTGVSTDGDDSDYPATFAGSAEDGTPVFFETRESLVSADTDMCDFAPEPAGCVDVYQLSGGVTTGISTEDNSNFPSPFLAASADGTRVLFEATGQLDDEDDDGAADIYERSGGTTTGISTDGDGAFAATFEGAAADATRVFFSTNEAIGGAGDGDTAADIYEHFGGATTGVSTAGDGSFTPTFAGASEDGTRAFFETDEPMPGAGDSDTMIDVYEHSGGTTTGVSTSGDGALGAGFAGSSEDGTRVFFGTEESLVAGDADTTADVYERFGGTTTGISIEGDDNARGAEFAGASTDGTRVFFVTANSLSGSDTDDCDGSPGIQGCQDVYEASISPPAPPPAPPGGGGEGLTAGDTDPPETSITAGPKAKTKKKSATFTFSSDEPGSTFECSVDDEAFEACTSPEQLKAGKGKHSFEVRAIDPAGNTDPTPADQSWKVKKKK
jgi:hypothetical protein